jgi:hypothetical protein
VFFPVMIVVALRILRSAGYESALNGQYHILSNARTVIVHAPVLVVGPEFYVFPRLWHYSREHSKNKSLLMCVVFSIGSAKQLQDRRPNTGEHR